MTETVKVFSGSQSGKVKYPYDAMVYIDGTSVIAVDSEGNTIKRGVAGTDDASVMQAAIDKQGTIYISEGTYLPNTTIDIISDTKIIGSGSKTLMKPTGFSVNGSVFRNKNIEVPSIVDKNIIISDIAFDISNYGPGPTEVESIILKAVGNIIVERCFIDNPMYFGVFVACGDLSGGIYTHSKNVIIRDNFICNAVWDGIGVDRADDIIVCNNVIDTVAITGIVFEDCTNCICDGNRISNTTQHGITASASLTNNILIIKNIISQCTLDGIHVDGAIGNITIDSNFITTVSRYGIDVSGISGNVTITNNNIKTPWCGIRIDSSYATNNNTRVSGNTIDTSTTYGLLTSDKVNNSIFSENYICDSTYYGICHGGGTNNKIINNTIKDTKGGYESIAHINGTNTIISGNTIYGTTHKRSLYIANGNNTCVFGNYFTNGSNGILYDTITNLSRIYNNSGYVHISEIRETIDRLIDVMGTPRLLTPFSETTGTSISDYTRLGNTIYALASVATQYGFCGRATYYNFNGSTERLYIPNDTDFDFGDGSGNDTAFSIICCLNPDNVTSRFIIGKWDVNNQREWRLFFDASGYPTLQLYDESADKYIGRQDQTAFTTGSWKVLVTTYSASKTSAGIKIYIDGVQVDDTNYEDAGYNSMDPVVAQLQIGALKNAAAYSEYFDGKLTWIGVAAKELSADEVWSLTQRLKGVLGI